MIFQIILVAALSSLVAANIIPVHHAPQPYKFGYDIKDKHGQQYREETGDGASGVKGSYGFTDARGVRRHVDYVADHAGFRAQVKTNEPGTANQDPAAVKMISDAPYAGGVALGGLGYGGLGYGGLGYGGHGYGGHGYGGHGYGGLGYGGLGYEGLGYEGLGYGGLKYGGLGNEGLGYGGLGGVGYGNFGYGYGGLNGAYGGYGVGAGLLGGLGYARYGY